MLEDKLESFVEGIIDQFTVSESLDVAADQLPDEDEHFDYWLAINLSNKGGNIRPSWSQLSNIIKASRRIWATSEICKQTIRNRVNFILGDFISFDLIPSDIDSLDVNGAINRLKESDEVREASNNWMRFYQKNDFYDRLFSLLIKRDRDGDAALRIFDGSSDIPELRFIDALQIRGDISTVKTRPNNVQTPDSVGIVTAKDDIESFQGVVKDAVEYIKDVYLFSASEDYDAVRSLPILYSVFTNIRRADKILRNSSVLTSIQTAVAMIRRHKQGTAAGISAFANRNATGSRQDRSTGNTQRTKRYHAGTILDARDGTEYDFPAHRLNPQSWIAPVHEELSRIALAAMIPVDWLLAKATEDPLTPGDPYLRNQKVERKLLYNKLEKLYWDVQRRMGVDVEALQEKYQLQISSPVTPTAKALDQARIDDIYAKWSALSPQEMARRNGTRYPIMRAEILMHRETKQDDEQFPGDAGMTTVNGGDGMTKANGDQKRADGDGGDNE